MNELKLGNPTYQDGMGFFLAVEPKGDLVIFPRIRFEGPKSFLAISVSPAEI